MKSEVKIEFPHNENQKLFALGLAGRPFEGSCGVRLRHSLLAGQISGPGMMYRYSQGSGYTILAASNSFTGGVQMDARVLGLGHKNSLGTGTLTVGNPTNPPANTLELATIAELTGTAAVTNPGIFPQTAMKLALSGNSDA